MTLLNRLAVDLANDLEFVQAAEHTEAAVALAHETGDERVVATALDSRKLIAAYLGDFGVLGATVATLDGILRRHNDLWILSFALAESAIEPAARARWDEAVGLVEEALAMKRRIGDKSGQPLLLAMLSWVHRSRGAYQNALDTAGEALDLAVEIDHPWWTAWAGANLGATLLELRCPEQATKPLVRAHAAAEAVGVRSQLLRSCAHLAWTRWLSGDASQADSMLRRAETLLADVHAPDGKAWLFGADAYLAVARLDLARNEPARALEVVTPLVAAADAAGWGEPLALGLALVGRSQWAVGSPESAKTVLTRALAVAETHTLPAPVLEAHTALTNICRAEGDQRAADAHSTDALEIITRDGRRDSHPRHQGALHHRVKVRSQPAGLGLTARWPEQLSPCWAICARTVPPPRPRTRRPHRTLAGRLTAPSHIDMSGVRPMRGPVARPWSGRAWSLASGPNERRRADRIR